MKKTSTIFKVLIIVELVVIAASWLFADSCQSACQYYPYSYLNPFGLGENPKSNITNCIQICEFKPHPIFFLAMDLLVITLIAFFVFRAIRKSDLRGFRSKFSELLIIGISIASLLSIMFLKVTSRFTGGDWVLAACAFVLAVKLITPRKTTGIISVNSASEAVSLPPRTANSNIEITVSSRASEIVNSGVNLLRSDRVVRRIYYFLAITFSIACTLLLILLLQARPPYIKPHYAEYAVILVFYCIPMAWYAVLFHKRRYSYIAFFVPTLSFTMLYISMLYSTMRYTNYFYYLPSSLFSTVLHIPIILIITSMQGAILLTLKKSSLWWSSTSTVGSLAIYYFSFWFIYNEYYYFQIIPGTYVYSLAVLPILTALLLSIAVPCFIYWFRGIDPIQPFISQNHHKNEVRKFINNISVINWLLFILAAMWLSQLLLKGYER